MMLQELNEQIVQVKEQLKHKRKLNTQLEDYQSELLEIKSNINRLQEQLKEEQKDVQKLEGISISNFFSTITGTKYEKLDKENKEVLAVQLQLEEAENTKNSLETSISKLNEKLKDLHQTDHTYQKLLNQKEQLIKETGTSYANKLYELSEDEGDTQAYIKEINEAIRAGEKAESALHSADEALNSASNWGTLDMLGGGLITSAVKHSKIDGASDYIHAAQSKMRDFQKELLDIQETIQVNTEISGLLKFADFFFDGLIVDWMVQGKINESKKQVQENLLNVRKILNTLKHEQSKSQNKLAKIKEERKRLIETV